MAARKLESRDTLPGQLVLLLSFWTLLLAAMALLIFMSRSPEAGTLPGVQLVQSPSFSLRGAEPSQLALVGSSLVRVGEEGIAVLDASGQEQSFIDFPYRESQVFPMGQGLLVTPLRGSGYLALFPDLSAHESSLNETVYGTDYQEPYLLTFGPSLKGRFVASLLDTRLNTYRAVLTFDSLQWPLSVSFVPGTPLFDVVLLDMTQGEPITRYMTYDLDGQLVNRLNLPSEGLLPHQMHLSGGRTLLFSQEAGFLYDHGTGTAKAVEMPAGNPVQAESRLGQGVLLTREGGKGALSLTLEGDAGRETLFQRLQTPESVNCFALAPSGHFLLAADDRGLMMVETSGGQIQSRLETDQPLVRLLALSDQYFLLIFQEEAAILTVR